MLALNFLKDRSYTELIKLFNPHLLNEDIGIYLNDSYELIKEALIYKNIPKNLDDDVKKEMEN